MPCEAYFVNNIHLIDYHKFYAGKVKPTSEFIMQKRLFTPHRELFDVRHFTHGFVNLGSVSVSTNRKGMWSIHKMSISVSVSLNRRENMQKHVKIL